MCRLDIQIAERHVVPSHRQGAVAEDSLEREDITTSAQKSDCRGVPQLVWVDTGHSRTVGHSPHDLAYPLVGESRPLRAQEECVCIGFRSVQMYIASERTLHRELSPSRWYRAARSRVTPTSLRGTD